MADDANQDVVVTASKEWGYNLDILSPDRADVTEHHRIKDKSEHFTLSPQSSVWVDTVVPKEAKLKLDGNGNTNIFNVGVEAGGTLAINGDGGTDYFKPSIKPATNQEDLKKYKPGQVTINGGGGQDVVIAPADSIITRLPDDKKGAHYRFTDNNGYSFDTTSIETVRNAAPPPAPPTNAPSKRNGPELPRAAIPGTELNTLDLQVGQSMTVAEATKTLFDPRVTTVLDAADKKVIDAYNAKLGACLADKGDLALCKDIKLDMPSVSDMGAEPASAKHELYTGQLPAPRVVNAAPPDVKGPAR